MAFNVKFDDVICSVEVVFALGVVVVMLPAAVDAWRVLFEVCVELDCSAVVLFELLLP